MTEVDFTLQCEDRGVEFFSHTAPRFKTSRVDLFLSTPLRRGQNTRLALIGRLLERGTRRLPGLQKLNRFLDGLYGANFAVEVEALGDRQVLHLWLEAVAPRFLPGREDVLGLGASFLGEVLAEPVTRDGGFRRDYLRQEKKALAAQIRGLANDKSALAHRRCLELMCADAPCGLPAHGDARDFRGITAQNLYSTHRQLLAQSPISIFLTGHPAPQLQKELGRALHRWERATPGSSDPREPLPPTGPAREVFEAHEVGQARLVLGYRTGITMAGEGYPALALLNSMLGGDSQSRLFRHLREEAGLCYHIGTHLEPLCGLFFIEAGIEAAAYAPVRERIDHQLQAMCHGAFEPAELDLSRQILQRNLWALDDSCEGLVRFHHQHRLAGVNRSRQSWHHLLGAVDRDAVVGVAEGLKLDTAFLLYPCHRKGGAA